MIFISTFIDFFCFQWFCDLLENDFPFPNCKHKK
jgi:hypothetical protein